MLSIAMFFPEVQSADGSGGLPTLNNLLDSAGFSNIRNQISSQQLNLVDDLSRIYEDENIITEAEMKLQHLIGSSMPTERQKNILDYIFEKHYEHSNLINSIKEKLEEEVQKSTAFSNKIERQ